MSFAKKIWLCGWLLLAIGGLPGCSPLQPKSIRTSQVYRSPELVDNQPQIQRGEPHRVLDAVGWVVGIPSKIILWNRRAENHNIGAQTEQAVAEYLAVNHLDTVRVRLNQYHPGEDWRRLVKNRSVGAGWRYTFGVVSVLGETIFPGRIFGGDHFNPYTNTIHLYSDIPTIGLHEAAHAKDFARRKWKGTYAAVYSIPIVPLYHESIASRDVRAYIEALGSPEQSVEAVRVLYPAYGTYVGSAAGNFLPSTPVYIGAVVGGHLLAWRESKAIWHKSTIPALSDLSQPYYPLPDHNEIHPTSWTLESSTSPNEPPNHTESVTALPVADREYSVQQ